MSAIQQFRRTFGSTAAARKKSITTKPRVSWLDLQGCGLSALERLCLEEALLRHDPLERSWGIVGTHDPTYHSRLRLNNRNDSTNNEDCVIVLGLGGKPDKLLNLEKLRQDGVHVLRRFSGGGTVVLDNCSLWTTFIGRTKHFSHIEPYPREIMNWSAKDVFGPAFHNLKQRVISHVSGNASTTPRKSLVVDSPSCGMAQGDGKSYQFASSSTLAENSSFNIPDFSLRENDYVLGEQKMGGNAQAIVKGAWLHHTSFLWDYETENMEYLALPEKRPEYRGDRDHDDFLVKLKTHYEATFGTNYGKRAFFEEVKAASAESFELEEVSLREALEVIDELGGFQKWFDGKCRTRIEII